MVHTESTTLEWKNEKNWTWKENRKQNPKDRKVVIFLGWETVSTVRWFMCLMDLILAVLQMVSWAKRLAPEKPTSAKRTDWTSQYIISFPIKDIQKTCPLSYCVNLPNQTLIFRLLTLVMLSIRTKVSYISYYLLSNLLSTLKLSIDFKMFVPMPVGLKKERQANKHLWV